MARRTFGPSKSRPCNLCLETSNCDSCDYQLVGCPQCGRKRGRVEFREPTLGFAETPDEEEVSNLEIPSMRRVYLIAMRFERRSRTVKCRRSPAKVARGERDLSLRNAAPRASHNFFRTEGPRSTPQEILRSNEIAELCHRHTPQRERRCVIAQGDPLQGAEGITRSQCTSRVGDQRAHRNPVTFVTPTVRKPGAKLNGVCTCSQPGCKNELPVIHSSPRTVSANKEGTAYGGYLTQSRN